MWMTIHNALDGAKADPPDDGEDLAHGRSGCRRPDDCLRVPSPEPRSFSNRAGTRVQLLARYRRMLAERCDCNSHCLDVRT